MESNRGVVCLEPRKLDHGVVLKSLTTNSYRSDRHIRRQRGAVKTFCGRLGTPIVKIGDRE